MDVTDRAAILNGGRIAQVGSPAELRCRPSTPFVQAFLN
jgi:ABC-type Fe3+/spermidine/putrescine transport system ATPase subunit